MRQLIFSVLLSLALCGSALAQTPKAAWNGSGALPTGFEIGHNNCNGTFSPCRCQIVANGATTDAGQILSTWNNEQNAVVCSAINGAAVSNNGIAVLRIYTGPNTCDLHANGVAGTSCNPPTSDGYEVTTWKERDWQQGINSVQSSSLASAQQKFSLTGRYAASGQNQHEGFMISIAKGEAYVHAGEDSGFDLSTQGGWTVLNITEAPKASWGDTWRQFVLIQRHDATASGGVGCGYPELYVGLPGGVLTRYWDWNVMAPQVTGQVSGTQAPGCLAGFWYNGTNAQMQHDIGLTYVQNINPGASDERWITDPQVCINSTRTAALTDCGFGSLGLPTVTPTPYDFGSQQTGTISASQTFTFTNPTGSAVTFGVGAITKGGANPGQYSIDTDNCSSSSVAAGATCTVIVTFRPTLVQSSPATLVFTNSASNSPQTIILAGTGTGAAAPTASLTCSPFVQYGTPISCTSTTTNADLGCLGFYSYTAGQQFLVSLGAVTCNGTWTFTPAQGVRSYNMVKLTANGTGGSADATVGTFYVQQRVVSGRVY